MIKSVFEIRLYENRYFTRTLPLAKKRIFSIVRYITFQRFPFKEIFALLNDSIFIHILFRGFGGSYKQHTDRDTLLIQRLINHIVNIIRSVKQFQPVTRFTCFF